MAIKWRTYRFASGSGTSIPLWWELLIGEAKIARNFPPRFFGSQEKTIICRRNVRSSSLSNLESSALRACMEHGGSDRGAVDVSQGAGPAQGTARCEQTAHNPETGSSGVGTERALCAQAAGAP